MKIDQAVTRARTVTADLIRDLKHIHYNVSEANRTLAEAEAAFSPVIGH